MAREMKDSGIAWIGEIPVEWSMKRLKYLVSYNDETLGESTEADYSFNYIDISSVEYGRGVTQLQYMKFKDAPSRARRLVRPGDVIVSTVRTYLKAVATIDINDTQLIASTGFIVLRAREKEIASRFLNYAVLSDAFISMVEAKSVGISYPAINASDVVNLTIPTPPIHEQHRIATFLDTECSRIDSVIEQTRASIEEYKKLKQSVITQAVTKGIRPNRKMKNSGIEWIGEIPEEWSVSRVGLHFDIILGKMLCSNQPSEDYSFEPYYCAANVHFDGVSNDALKQMWFSSAEKEQYRVHSGDLLVVEGGAGAGGCAIVREIHKPIYVQNSIMIVRPKRGLCNRYLKYLLESLVKKGYIDVVCNKATIPHFTKEKLSDVPMPISQEQKEIADFLDEQLKDIDKLISKKEEFLIELESYKKSLIFEYVTGKKEVPV